MKDEPPICTPKKREGYQKRSKALVDKVKWEHAFSRGKEEEGTKPPVICFSRGGREGKPSIPVGGDKRKNVISAVIVCAQRGRPLRPNRLIGRGEEGEAML